MRSLTVFAVVAAAICSVRAECPAVDDIPVMDYEEDEFSCARIYHGIGADSALQACQGCEGWGEQRV